MAKSSISEITDKIEHRDGARALRIQASREFAATLDNKTAQCGIEHVERSKVQNELNQRVAMIRRLSEPRTELPIRLMRYRFVRMPIVQRNLLRIWNYMTRPSRTNTQLLADCIDIIQTELDRLAKEL